MKNKLQSIKKFFLVGALMVGALTVFGALPEAAATQFLQGDENIPGGETDFRTLVLTIISYFLGFLGLLATIMIIYGGITYVSSAGNDEAVGKAKKIILYAVIGIIVILLSFVIVNAVLGAQTGG